MLQLLLAAIVVLLAGSGAKACSEFAVDQSAPLLILTLGVVVAAVLAGLPGGIAALLFSLAVVLLIRDDVAPGLSDSRFLMVAAAFTGAGLTAATAYGMAERAYRRTARERDRASDLATELARAVAAKDEFLGLVSHEMRTPMTQIIGNSRALDRRWRQMTPNELQAAVHDNYEQAERLFAMLENMLVLSRVERGALVEGEPLLLQRIVAGVLADFRQRHPGREIRTEIPDALPPVMGQQSYVAQVLQNLVSNSDKYTRRGEPVDVRLHERGGWVHMEVLDRGPGLRPEDAARIYEAYERLPPTAETTSGAGLGLTVCKRVTEALGGTIAASPRPGGGTVFTVSLPAVTGIPSEDSEGAHASD